MKHFLKRLTGFSIGSIIGALISIIQVPILTRLIAPDQYGFSNLYRNLMLNLPTFLYIGMDQAFSREYYFIKNKKYLFQQATVLPLIAGGVMFIVMMTFRSSLSRFVFGSAEYGYIIFFSGFLLLALILERFIMLSIRMEEKAKEYSIFTIFLKLSIFITSLALVFLGMRDFRVIVFGLILGHLIGDTLLFLRYRQLINWSGFQLDPALIKLLLQFGLPLMLAMSLTSLLNTIDNIMLRQFSTATQLGIYGAGLNIVNIIGIIRTAFATFWTPTAYRWYDEDKSIKHFKFISDAVLFILSAMFFMILVFRPVIIMILGEEYESAQYILGLLSFPHIMYTLSETTTLGIVFSRKTYFNIFVSALALLPSILLNVLLTPLYGAVGAAAASCGAYVVFYLARTYFSHRTGFSFSQKKQLISVALMILTAALNAFPINNRLLLTSALGLICFIIQIPTLLDALSVWQQPEKWNFN